MYIYICVYIHIHIENVYLRHAAEEHFPQYFKSLELRRKLTAVASRLRGAEHWQKKRTQMGYKKNMGRKVAEILKSQWQKFSKVSGRGHVLYKGAIQKARFRVLLRISRLRDPPQ